MQLNVLDDLAEAMKALDGKKYLEHRIHPNMTPSPPQRRLTQLNNHRHLTKKPETYSPKQCKTRRRMDSAHGAQLFEHTSICMPWFVNSSRRFMRPPKNTPHAAKVPRMHPNTGLDNKNSLRSHHNSRPNCYTACPPCPNRGRWPKSQLTWTQQANGIKNGKTFLR